MITHEIIGLAPHGLATSATHDVLNPTPPATVPRGYVIFMGETPLRFNRNVRGLCYEPAIVPRATVFNSTADAVAAIQAAKVPCTDELNIKAL